ncbi:MAG: amidohydrolase family protein, partial [Bacteroidia bacterium]|nr:amidohydrolase family protein [Bacteroidia bacterium]
HRWGRTPEELKIEGADPFIKFALGENVKQSNWGERFTTRYPQTRMGVEQTMKDGFQAALDYKKAWDEYKAKGGAASSWIPPRKNLELDALLEILEKKRFITCHSYVQSEINMLMKLAESFGFLVNTFTHILEGYKVADKMAKHGVAGSSFADWWAYKYEVIDAIPYNPAIMHEQGVTVAINSDDAEMARRLNQEAAKCIKYGNVKPEEAWKFVTLNPAKMLHLTKRLGTIEPNKDADLVLWSDNPLSVYAKPLQTYVDGIKLFDTETDQKMRKDIEVQRTRLIQKMLKAKEEGSPVSKPSMKAHFYYHCEDMDSHYNLPQQENW